jgi:hypothetical protein
MRENSVDAKADRPKACYDACFVGIIAIDPHRYARISGEWIGVRINRLRQASAA